MESAQDSGQVGSTGARFGANRHRAESDQGGVPAHGPRFEVMLRGYDRAAVDAHLASRLHEAEELRAALADAERRVDRAVRRAEAAEAESADRARVAAAEPAPADTGFGSRAEKILRLAEREAAEVRSRATAESTAILDAARSEAEQHRHDVERQLISRVSRAEQAAAQLEAELHERDEQMTRKLDADREEARRVQDSAMRAADVLRAAAEAEAEEIRLTARAEAEHAREQSRQDLARLGGLRNDVRVELDRIVRLLHSEAGGQSRPAENVASVSARE